MKQEVLTNPYAQQPSSLEDPVPREPAGNPGGLEGLSALGAEIKIPAPEEAQPQEEQAQESGGLSGLANLGASVSMGGEFGVPVEQDPEFLGQQTFTGQSLNPRQLRINRFLVGMLGSDTERMDFLKKAYGKENVKKTSDNFLIRPPGATEFQKLDSESFEPIADLMYDESREIMMAAVGTAGATKAFGATPGPPVLKALAGAVAGVASAGGTSIAIDKTMQYLYGIQRDPSRGGTDIDPITLLPDKERGWWQKQREIVQEAANEGAVTMVFEALFRGVGRLLRNRRTLRKEMKQLRDAPPTETSFKNVSDAAEGAEILNQTPGTIPIPGTNERISPNFILGQEAPELHAMAESVLRTPEGLKLQEISRENLKTGILDHVSNLLQMSGKEAERLMKAKGTGKAKQISGRINRLFEQVKSSEGATMNEMLKSAELVQGPTNIRTQNTAQVLDELFDQGGQFRLIRNMDGSVTFPDSFDELFDANFSGTSASEYGVKKVKQEMKNIITRAQQYRSGTVVLKKRKSKQPSTIEDLVEFNNFVTRLNGFTGKLSDGKKSNLFTKQIARLNKAMRKDRIDTVDMKLSQDQNLAKSFAEPIARYREAIQVEDTVGRLLSENQMTQKGLVKSMFNNRKDALENLVRLKAFLGKHEPEAWDAVKTAFIDEVVENSVQDNVINIKKFRKELFGRFGNEFTEVLFDGQGNGVKNLNKILFLGERFEAQVAKGNEGKAMDIFGEMVEVLPGVTGKFGPHSINAASAFLRFGSTQQERIKMILQKAPLERYLKKLPEHHKAPMRETLSALFNFGAYVTERGLGGNTGAPARAGMTGLFTERNNYVEQ